MGSETSGITTIGRHRVRCGNIYERDGIDQLVGDDCADVFYSDPPWGTGAIKLWDTLNKRDNPDAQANGFSLDVDDFLNVTLDSARRYTVGFVAIEYGKRWTDRLIAKAVEHYGLYYCDKVETLYKGSGKLLPMDIVVFHTDEPKMVDLSPAYHTVGYPTVKAMFGILKPAANAIGMDLCCGMGYTAQACIDNGMRFIGNELNAKRLQKTIARLKKAEGL